MISGDPQRGWKQDRIVSDKNIDLIAVMNSGFSYASGLFENSDNNLRFVKYFPSKYHKAFESFSSKSRHLPKECGLLREIDFIKKDRTLFPCSISISLLRDNNHKTIGSISILRDLTEWKEAQRKLKELSLYDALTGLYNRTFFEEEMKRLSNGRYCPMGIIMCDINGLKLINDTKGHEKGDELLKLAAEIFKRCFRASDIIARIGGDEFAILLPESNQEIVSTCSNRIRQEVRNYNKNDLELGLSISIGSSVKFYPPVDMNKLFKEADDAMYKEKLQQNFSSRSETALALIKTMEARDYITNGHAKRLQDYAQQLGRTLRLSEQRLNDLKLLGRFHDLGKVGVPDRILFKSGPLNKEEFNEMKRHCEIGHRIALSLSDLAPIADFILKHHEWWNGQGYQIIQDTIGMSL